MKNKNCVNTNYKAKRWEIYYNTHNAAKSILIINKMQNEYAIGNNVSDVKLDKFGHTYGNIFFSNCYIFFGIARVGHYLRECVEL